MRKRPKGLVNLDETFHRDKIMTLGWHFRCATFFRERAFLALASPKEVSLYRSIS